MIQVWLYELTQGATVYRWTSRDTDITVGGNVWTAKDIEHDQISKTSDLSDSGGSITLGTVDAANPLRGLLAGPAAAPIHVRILESFGPAFSTIFVLFEGDVKKARYGKSGEIVATLSSILRVADQQSPRYLVQQPCNWQFGEANTCRLNVVAMQITGVIGAVSGNTVTVEACLTEATARAYDDWFSLGVIVCGTETRLIMAVAGAVLTLNAPFVLAQPGNACTAMPGCDHQWGTCKAKFGNGINYGGMPFVPQYNPLISQGNINYNNGKKGNRSHK